MTTTSRPRATSAFVPKPGTAGCIILRPSSGSAFSGRKTGPSLKVTFQIKTWMLSSSRKKQLKIRFCNREQYRTVVPGFLWIPRNLPVAFHPFRRARGPFWAEVRRVPNWFRPRFCLPKMMPSTPGSDRICHYIPFRIRITFLMWRKTRTRSSSTTRPLFSWSMTKRYFFKKNQSPWKAKAHPHFSSLTHVQMQRMLGLANYATHKLNIVNN